MSIDDRTLQVEISIRPAKGGRGGPGREASTPKQPDPPRIPRITRLMALAIKFQDMVDRGEVRDYADLARLGFVTRARMTQIMNMLNLAPDIQEEVLAGTSPRMLGIAERRIRSITKMVSWQDQRRAWANHAGGEQAGPIRK